MIIKMNLGQDSYDIIVERSCMASAERYLELDRRVMIVTDDGVPEKYPQALLGKCKEGYIFRFAAGEAQKTLETYGRLLSEMQKHSFTRDDCVVAVGGGISGDLAGFAAATYMRGVDFYNIPTTLLAQTDSSIGGKTGVNLDGVKNTVGAFYQPRRVLVDPCLLSTLPRRQFSNGLAEAIKMSLTFDAGLFALFENSDTESSLDTVIEKSLLIKKSVVERDEKEAGLRQVLNFGHTVGHGIETCGNGLLYHGECVALGMLPMCSESVRKRLIQVLMKAGLPVELPKRIKFKAENIIKAALHDKKRHGDSITAVYVEEIGSFEFRKMSIEAFERVVREGLL